MSTILVIGEVLFDCFPDGHRVLGGAPFNVAWHLRGFGATPAFASAVGEDAHGREVLRRMQAWGMSTAGVQVLPERETGRVEVHDPEGSPQYVIPEDSAWDHFEDSPDRTPARSPRMLYQGSLFLRHERSRNGALALAKRTGAPRFVDVNLRPPWFDRDVVLALIFDVHCLKVSADELRQISDWLGNEAHGDIASQARALQKRCRIAHCFVTVGEEGALWVEASGPTHRAPAFRVEPFIDSVGAGDASAAVALLGLTSGWSIPVTLDRAMEFAGRICSIQGAIPHGEEFYDDPVRKWKLRGE